MYSITTTSTITTSAPIANIDELHYCCNNDSLSLALCTTNTTNTTTSIASATATAKRAPQSFINNYLVTDRIADNSSDPPQYSKRTKRVRAKSIVVLSPIVTGATAPYSYCHNNTLSSAAATTTTTTGFISESLEPLSIDLKVISLLCHSAPTSPNTQPGSTSAAGYLKKIAKIESYKESSNSVHALTSSPSLVGTSGLSSHHPASIPKIRLMDSNHHSTNLNVMEIESITSIVDKVLEAEEEDEDEEVEEDYEEEDDCSGEPSPAILQTNPKERTKRRRRRHLLPSSLFNLLPPVSVGHRSRSNSNSGDSDRSIGGSSSRSRSGRSGKSRGNSSSEEIVEQRPSKPTPSRKSKKHGREQRLSNISTNLPRDQITRKHSNSSNQPGSSNSATTPTTLCPTIASALWKPLWPPGWHPRSSSTATTTGATQHPTFAAVGANNSSNVATAAALGRAAVPDNVMLCSGGAGGGSAGGSGHLTVLSQQGPGSRSSSQRNHHLSHLHIKGQPQQQQTSPGTQFVFDAKMCEPNNNNNKASSSQHSSSHSTKQRHHSYQHTKSSNKDCFSQQVNNYSGEFNSNNSTQHRPKQSTIDYLKTRTYDIFNNEDYEHIEDWLDEHPNFVHSYFVRKASRSLIDSWLLTHSSSIANSGTLSANQPIQSNDNSGANTPVRKISAHEFEASGGGYLRPMVSTTCDGTPTFLPIQDSERMTTTVTMSGGAIKENGIGGENGYSPSAGSATFGAAAAASVASILPAIPQSSSHQPSPVESSYAASQSSFSHHQSPLSPLPSPSSQTLNDCPSPSTTYPFVGQFPIIRNRHSGMSLKSREELHALNIEKELIFDLVKDICNDLDVRSLCHKILKNVSVLTYADRCSLFLVRGEKDDPNSRYLVSQLFDVSGQSTIEQMAQKEEITIPWGTGIVGYVAKSGESVNIPDCYKDSRFTKIIDQKTGYTTRNMLCNPIFDFNGEAIGVAQVINKNGDSHFTEKDENVFAQYLQFCGIGIRNAQLYERSQLENKRNQVLLDLARMVFEKQSNIESIIYRILIHILSLLQCERCQILLLADEPNDADFYYYGRTYQDPYVYFNMVPSRSKQLDSQHSESLSISSNASSTTPESSPIPPVVEAVPAISGGAGARSFSRAFDMEASDLQQIDFEKSRQCPYEGRFPVNIGITGYVASTGDTLNIPDAYSDSRFDPIVDKNSPNGFRHQSILCMPIRNAERRIIGVAQLVNKLNGRPFNKNDENLFEAFAIFSGMGIENTQMFEKAVKSMAKQKVTLELLSYHASASNQEAAKYARMLIPSTSSLSLANLRFDDFSLNEDQMIKACIRMFIDLDLIERFHIDYKVLCKWILSVKKNYRPVLYHNWRHAFNVAQMMFAIFVNTNMCLVLGELETLALIVACLCHDLDHRGTNNSFQIKTESPLSQLYSTSTLEHHHFDQSLMILNSQGNQILSNLSPEEYRGVVNVLEEAILATDLAVYFRRRNEFFNLVNNQSYDWTNKEHRSLLRSMLMTCCDIAAITKPWEIQKVVAELVASEFFQQGDIEKEQLNIEPIDMMNREKKEQLPKMQISFIDSICMPVYDAFVKLCPQQLKVLVKGVVTNREAWEMLSNEPYQLNIKSPNWQPIVNRFAAIVPSSSNIASTVAEIDDTATSNISTATIETSSSVNTTSS